MARLTELPSELLLNVILYLTTRHPSDVRTLLHLCLTSRLLCDIARPALYKCVQIKEPGGESLRPSKQLFRTLLEHPSLAQKVHEFTLRNDLLAGFRPPNIGKDAIVTEISRVLRDLGLEMETDFCRYPLATDILARLPNLKHLEITARVELPRAFVRRLHQLQTSRSILANLKSFYLINQYGLGPVNIREYIPFLRYPSFERFSTINVAPYAPDGPPATNVLSHSAVELIWSMGPLSTMRQLIDNCMHLEHFSLCTPDPIRHRFEIREVGYEPLVTPRDLIRALLATHRSTLKTLRLDFHYYYHLGDEELRQELEEAGERLEDCYVTYPSLRDFECLSHLTIEFEKLVRVRDLPETLISLELQYCRFVELDMDCLRQLRTLKGTWCPLIESVIVSGWEKDNYGISKVLASAQDSDLSVLASADGRILTLMGTDYQVQVISYKFPA